MLLKLSDRELGGRKQSHFVTEYTFKSHRSSHLPTKEVYSRHVILSHASTLIRAPNHRKSDPLSQLANVSISITLRREVDI